MATKPSVYDEERNRLRLRAWEQRNQETSQAKELGAENVPLFGQPYKTNKGDELSNRIQRMLGSYEDVNNSPDPPAAQPNFTESDRGQPNTSRPGTFLVQDPTHHVTSQNRQSNNYPFQTTRDISTSSPNHNGCSLTIPKASVDHQKQVAALSDLRENATSPQESSAQSLDVKPIPFLHSSEAKSTFDSRQDSTDTPSANMADGAALNLRHSPADASLHQAGKSGNPLLLQSLPPLPSSKQASVAVMQKPTAYVRPMDGQDQLLGGSPELKPSPESHLHPQEIQKSDHAKAKMLPQYLETKTNEAVCVEDILKEMTHSWPPLLTAIHIPKSEATPAKEEKQASSCPGRQQSHNGSPVDPHRLDVQNSQLFLHKDAHSSDVESASSSDSDSSSRSESDDDSEADEPCGPTVSRKTEADATARPGNWQLGYWIQSTQQNSGNETGGGPNVVCENPTPKLQRSSKHLTAEATKSAERGGKPTRVQPYDDRSHESSLNDGSLKHPDVTCKPPKDYVLSGDALADKAPSFSDRPKVKTKTEHSHNSSSDPKRKRTFKSAGMQKTESRLEVVQRDATCRCPSSPHSCSCHISTHTPPIKVSSSKAEVEVVREAKTIPKAESSPTHKSCKSSSRAPKSSQDIHNRPGGSLLVKIDLSLLSRVPRVTPGNVETKKHLKASKKTLPQTVELDDKTLPRKKRKLEKKMTSSNKDSSVKVEGCATQPGEQEHKKAKKKQAHLEKPTKDSTKDPKMHKGSHEEMLKSKDSSKQRSSHAKNTHAEKQKRPSSLRPPREVETSRHSLKTKDRQYPVKHYIKEAKRLKHKADAESDKLSKAFNYLDAAMFFVESGLAMEKDPQISMSSYTMFAETVELLKFVLKLKNLADTSAHPSEKDFVALCLKCQSLLQMAMFRQKHKTALKYSKTLTDHFNNPALESSVCVTKGPSTPSPMASIPSPACGSGSSVAVPVAVEQVALSYVNITTLFLSAHELWEQADQMAGKGSGLLAKLDAAVGPLSLTSSVSAMVRYTQRGVAWLRLDNSKTQTNAR
ncbi:AF4/FMR2 family member 1 isoform X1 [Hippocampus comes]|uniref:AF4/FMR2 family member 1 isoform X1 n=1 Tax=Hippocampus comes TaxID=109280 RepID=UPI00094E4B21|nr:PREDICTED: AF4/FMR2 family member 1-like isoform X1 [Hippocampus comes]